MPGKIVVFAIAAHVMLQMLSPAPWVNLAPLLVATIALALLPNLRITTEHSGLRAMTVAVACFLVSYTLSLAFSADWSISLEALLALLPGPLLFALVLQLGARSEDTRQLAIALNISALVGALYLLVVFTGAPAPGIALTERYSASFVVPNDVLFLVCLSPFAIHLLLYRQGAFSRLLAAVTLLAIAASILLAASRAGLLLATVMYVAYALKYSGRYLLIGLIPVVGTLILVDYLNDFEFLNKLMHTSTLFSRLVLWSAGIEGFLHNPLIGYGPGTFGAMYEKLAASGGLPEVIAHDKRSMGWAHSLYIESLAERGVLGLASLLGMYGTALALTVRGLRRANWYWGHRLFPVLASMMALLLAGAVELTFMRTWVVSLTFLLLGLCVIQTRDGEIPQSKAA
ncbi:MAG: O-antigen ligase family protein [Halieaceae bacterium]